MDPRNQNALAAMLSDFTTRVNDLEQRIKLVHDRVSILDQTLLRQNDRLIKEIKSMKDDITELKNKVEKFDDVTEHIVSESEEFARKEELAVFEKFMKMWEPMNFATLDDVKEMLQGIERKKSKDKIIPVEED
jgi:predicted  nucleic acid-binding Zn-ribbon protein